MAIGHRKESNVIAQLYLLESSGLLLLLLMLPIIRIAHANAFIAVLLPPPSISFGV